MSTSRTSNNPSEWRDIAGPKNRADLGRVRRMLIGVTSRFLWQLIGHRQLDGKTETREAEVFGGAGMISRPGGRNAEAVVIFQGEGASAPLVVGIRDQQMAAALAAALTGGALNLGELAIGAGVDGTVACLLHMRADGTVEVRTPSGVAKELVTFETFMRHTHVTAGTGPATTPTPFSGGALAGTTVIKGQ